MKLFFGEFQPNYEKYYFPYEVWLLAEKGDSLEKVYQAGFLPIRNKQGVYYLSRNIRVDLSKFTLSSENRRILNKTTDFTYDLLPLEKFNYMPSVQKFCKDYMEKRFGRGQITASGVKNIFRTGVYNCVFVWRKLEKIAGYAVCRVEESLLQYAHAFYDLSLMEENIGIRMLLQSVVWAKENSKQYAYLGTVYNQSALSYKTEFSGLEFFNGFTWSSNIEELKELIKRRTDSYLLKDKQYLNDCYDGDIDKVLNNYGIRVNL